MRGRLIAFAVLLAVLAFAWTRTADQRSTPQPLRTAASGQLADPPAPAPDVPANMTAAVGTSATVQTILLVESRRRQWRPVLDVSAVSLRLPVVDDRTDTPRAIPLLI